MYFINRFNYEKMLYINSDDLITKKDGSFTLRLGERVRGSFFRMNDKSSIDSGS